MTPNPEVTSNFNLTCRPRSGVPSFTLVAKNLTELSAHAGIRSCISFKIPTSPACTPFPDKFSDASVPYTLTSTRGIRGGPQVSSAVQTMWIMDRSICGHFNILFRTTRRPWAP